MINIERRGPATWITLDRPETLNAFTGQMQQGIRLGVEAGVADDDVRAVVLTGRGRAFSVGTYGGAVTGPWHTLFMREARLLPSLGYCAHEGGKDMEEAARMLADQPEVVDTVITHRFPLEDAVEAFRVAADKSSGAIRVVLQP